MDCPFCGSSQIMVSNSRPNSKRNKIWRRRKCLECNNTFTTYENINLNYLTVIKKSGKKERFSRIKLYASIYHSSLDKKGVDRGDASLFTEKIVSEVEGVLLHLRRKSVSTGEIKETVLKILRKRSPDTFLRYLAYWEGVDQRKLLSSVRRYFIEK